MTIQHLAGVADYSKLRVEHGCKETSSLGVPNLSDEGIPKGANICNYLGNDG